ncbi:MAG: CDP-alcohol phosphatidyltransferase family protein [Prevotellaceae bacterium]|jgi:CDP-diacylglycerol--serine O-phosphatidyltransferase|nr:CDP-alcohol phosphatidyltransferase family protein [Prevotellaceae bacterium]
MWTITKKTIPNILTSLNLLSGCLALVYVFKGEFEIVAYFLFFSVFFDFCDGLSARALKAYSALGLQLDSLADMVSFGVVPAAMLHQLLIQLDPDILSIPILGIPLYGFPFIIAIFSALRLAKFNIDERQHDSFIGLPTPANAIFIISTVLAADDYKFIHDILYFDVTIILLCIAMSILMVCEIPMFALKINFDENHTIKKNITKIIFLAISLIFIILFGFAGISLSIILYILLSVISCLLKSKISR